MEVNVYFVQDFGIKVAIEFKRSIANIGVLRIIISKFGYWQKLYLVILFIIDKDSKINLHYTILFLVCPFV